MDVLFHWIIPVVILLAFSRIEKRKIFLLSIFSILPDTDTFINMHRMVLHNIFIVIIPLLFSLALKKHKLITILIAYFLLSHIILDLEFPGVALFYPLINENFYFSIDFIFHNYQITPSIDYGIKQIQPTIPTGKFIADTSIMILILIGLLITGKILKKKFYR